MKIFNIKPYFLLAGIACFSASLNALDDAYRPLIGEAFEAASAETGQPLPNDLNEAIENVMALFDEQANPTAEQIANAVNAVLQNAAYDRATAPIEEEEPQVVSLEEQFRDAFHALERSSSPEPVETALRLAMQIYTEGIAQATTDEERQFFQQSLIIRVTFVFNVIKSQLTGNEKQSFWNAICRGLGLDINECQEALGEVCQSGSSIGWSQKLIKPVAQVGALGMSLLAWKPWGRSGSAVAPALVTAAMVLKMIEDFMDGTFPLEYPLLETMTLETSTIHHIWLHLLQVILRLPEGGVIDLISKCLNGFYAAKCNANYFGPANIAFERLLIGSNDQLFELVLSFLNVQLHNYYKYRLSFSLYEHLKTRKNPHRVRLLIDAGASLNRIQCPQVDTLPSIIKDLIQKAHEGCQEAREILTMLMNSDNTQDIEEIIANDPALKAQLEAFLKQLAQEQNTKPALKD